MDCYLTRKGWRLDAQNEASVFCSRYYLLLRATRRIAGLVLCLCD